MKFETLMQLIQPWSRIRVSDEFEINGKGLRIWSNTLTEAQVLAYWGRDVQSYVLDEKSLTVYVILKA